MKKKISVFVFLAMLLVVPSLFIEADQGDDDPLLGYRGGYEPGFDYGMMGPWMMGEAPGFEGYEPGFDYGMMRGGFGFGMWGLGSILTGNDPFDRMRILLNLNDNQVVQLRNLWLEFVRSASQAQSNLRIYQAQLQNLLAGSTVDMNQVEALINQMAGRWGDLLLARARMLLGVREVLTPEQLQQLSAFYRGYIPLGGPYGGYRYRSTPGAGHQRQAPMMPQYGTPP